MSELRDLKKSAKLLALGVEKEIEIEIDGKDYILTDQDAKMFGIGMSAVFKAMDILDHEY